MTIYRVSAATARPHSPAFVSGDSEASSSSSAFDSELESSTLTPSTTGAPTQPSCASGWASGPASRLPRWVHATNVLGRTLQRHIPPRINLFHPSHVEHPERPYEPTAADQLRVTWAAAGVQVGFGVFGLQLAIDQLFPSGPSPFNPSGQRSLVAGILLAATSVPGLVYTGSGLANLFTLVVQASARRDGPMLAEHPRAAAAGGYVTSTTLTAGAIAGSLIGCAALDARLQRDDSSASGSADVAALAALLLTLSATLVPVTGWYLGQDLGACLAAGAAGLRRRVQGPVGPIALG